ncbi:MAG: tRNA (adenosine(37)-N6)-threonylcarbamoyltransferase complex ATPase subunit type 1 TsaE [Saprospiraceae bacterium]|nr:tRNA (adenosine(37)-N6)-threonylcarbamoyltransferase complex ATPase subunit type 1 TsaE [Saprospiraceae bacterium]
MHEFIVSTKNDLPDAVLWVLAQAKGQRKIMLYGEMGAGKTTFTKAFCQHFGVDTTTSSPTFSLVNEYFFKNTEGGREVIHHLDLYRLKNLEEAMDIGIEDYLYDDSYCLIEWPQIIEPIMPEDVLKINIELIEDSMRKIVIL